MTRVPRNRPSAPRSYLDARQKGTLSTFGKLAAAVAGQKDVNAAAAIVSTPRVLVVPLVLLCHLPWAPCCF